MHPGVDQFLLTGFAGCAQYAVWFPSGELSETAISPNCPRKGINRSIQAIAQQRSALAVKKLVLSTVAVALACGCVLWFQKASAQDTAAAAPTKVGLIDMAYVFKNYEKFKALRDDLKTEIQGSDQQAKAMATKIKNIQDQLKAFKEGSPEFLQKESELTKLGTEFEVFRKAVQRDFLRKEADIYKTVYMEVSDAVKLYAQHYKYAVILRFNREEIESSSNPDEVLQSMNRQVVYFSPRDDITDAVLKYLNQKYQPQTTNRPTQPRN
jgi:outer membrane protein